MSKRLIILITLFFFSIGNSIAGRVEKKEIVLLQPDQTKIVCYVSGDEYYHRVYDKNDYTIVIDKNGWYCYAVLSNEGIPVSSGYRVGKNDPKNLPLISGVKLSEEIYQQRREGNLRGSSIGPFSGSMTNIVILIRFSGEAEFTTSREYFNTFFNNPEEKSLLTYYQEVSYNQLFIQSTLFPICQSGVNNISFSDDQPRGYYLEYNATTNPIGYSTVSEQRAREKSLVKNAILFATEEIESQYTGDDVDINNDGYIDNIHFITKGSSDGWGNILWAHQNITLLNDVLICGKNIRDYTLIPEMQQSVRLCCHEMFHTLGAPDLYHYTYNGITTVGPWDIMDFGQGHMLAYMKWKYSKGTWIDDIPIITEESDIFLNPSIDNQNQAVAIPSPYAENELFILEYRKLEGLFETQLPEEGLLIYRVDTLEDGNATGPPDEVYIFRTDGTQNTSGNIYKAAFSSHLNKSSFTPETNPFPFLQNGCNNTLEVLNIGNPGATMSAHINPEITHNVILFESTQVDTTIILSWQPANMADSVMILKNATGEFIIPDCTTNFIVGDTLDSGDIVLYIGKSTSFQTQIPEEGLSFYLKIFTTSKNLYTSGINLEVESNCILVDTFPYVESFEAGHSKFYCWRQFSNSENEGSPWELFSTEDSKLQPYDGNCMVMSPDEFVFQSTIFTTPLAQFDTSKLYRLSYVYFNSSIYISDDTLDVLRRDSEEEEWDLIKRYIGPTYGWDHDSLFFSDLQSESMIGFYTYTSFMNDVQLDYLKFDELYADFLADQTYGTAPLTVNFTNTSVNMSPNCIWNFGDGATSTELNPSHVYTEKGFYTVSLQSEYDTLQDSEVKQNYIHVGSVGTQESESDDIHIYPNPLGKERMLTIDVNTEDLVEVTLYNLEGEQQYHNQIRSPQSITLKPLNPGLFLIKLYYGNHNIWKKIVIQP